MGDWSPNGAVMPCNSNLLLGRDDCWQEAEEVAKEIISCVWPTVVSDCRRKEVIEFVQNLIRSSIGCEVFPFGSVPLQTYLPDGDIDLTSFGVLNVDDALAENVFAVLQDVEHNTKAKYAVKDVQLIRAEVKIVKCLVQNIVVDISFNQLGGLCTLCFLEQVDRHIGKDHLFKRSIILIKAWCYYESRILGAHHGLISTYALETLVLYIFHVFHSSLTGPLAVLYKFLDYFSKFDWENYCISLNGPICISSFPEVTFEPPESCADLLLNNVFLRDCLNQFSISSGAPEVIARGFQMKHLNIVDPLKNNNNLGRSVSKGNFFRIRSAFQYGARKLGHILTGKSEGLPGEVQKFFASTMDRHGCRRRPDVHDYALLLHIQEGEATTYVSESTELNIRSANAEIGGVVNNSLTGQIRPAPHTCFPPVRNGNKNISDEDQVEQGNGHLLPACNGEYPSTSSREDSKPNKSTEALVATDTLADLGGDYESNQRNLQKGRWLHKRALGACFQSMPPVIPPHMAFRPNMFPPVSPGSNGVHHSPFYLVNQPMINGADFHIEEKPRMRGIGTYFPNVNQHADSQPMARERSFVILTSPRNTEHNVFPPEFLEGARYDFLPSHPYMMPVETMHASENFLHESPRLGFPDANGSANSHQGGILELQSLDQLPVDISAREESPHQQPNAPFTGSSDLSSETGNSQHMALEIQERIASKSFHLKDADDFPPLSS